MGVRQKIEQALLADSVTVLCMYIDVGVENRGEMVNCDVLSQYVGEIDNHIYKCCGVDYFCIEYGDNGDYAVFSEDEINIQKNDFMALLDLARRLVYAFETYNIIEVQFSCGGQRFLIDFYKQKDGRSPIYFMKLDADKISEYIIRGSEEEWD